MGERVRLTGMRVVEQTLRDRMADLVGQWPCVDMGMQEMARLRTLVREAREHYAALSRPRDEMEVQLGALLSLWPVGRVEADDEVHAELSAQARALYDRWWETKRGEVPPRPSPTSNRTPRRFAAKT